MNRSEYLKLWIAKASDDLRVVEHELALHESEWVTSAIGFHCQQAIEKLLKTVLVAYEKEPTKTHNLEKLLVEVVTMDQSFEGIELADLTEFAVDARYPGDSPVPTTAECQNYFKIAQDVYVRVNGIIDQILKDENIES